MSPDELVRSRPLSAQWRRSLMERLDSLAAVYGVASAVSNIAFPIDFRWYRAMPLDAAITPAGRKDRGRRSGRDSQPSRSGFAKRIWRMRDEPMPGVVLMLMADDVRLRHARRLLSTTHVPALFALEREAVPSKPGDRIWSPSAVSASLDLRYVLDRLTPGGELPVEPEPQRADFPADLAVEGPDWDISDQMLPFMLKATEKRALDLISDWPWIALGELAGLMGVSPRGPPRASSPSRASASRPGPGTRANASPPPTGGWRSWPAGTAPPSPWRGNDGASPSKTQTPRWSGATSPGAEAGSFSGTWSTPPPSTPSWAL